MKIRSVIALVLATSLFAAACSSATDAADAEDPNPSDTTTESTTSSNNQPLEPFEIAAQGDYAVGVTTLELEDPETDTDLTVDVWFPLADAASGEAHSYEFVPGLTYQSPNAISTDPDNIADGQFPLVVYSHGLGGQRWISSAYTEALASHGYIVISADHEGTTIIDVALGQQPNDENVLARPIAVSAIIDAALDPTEQDLEDFHDSIDQERIAVTGHSLGGFTSLATTIDLETDAGTHTADERVDAVIGLAPATDERLFSDEQLAAIDTPMLLIAGTDDESTPIEPNVTRPWELTTGAPAYRVDLTAAEHQSFTDICSYIDAFEGQAVPAIVTSTLDDFGADGCEADDMAIERALELTTTFTLRFLDEVLNDGPALDPATIDFPADVSFSAR